VLVTSAETGEGIEALREALAGKLSCLTGNSGVGKSSLLKNVTSGYHYHTIDAESEEILDAIQEELQQKGFLAKLQDYEPVDFWGGQE
jgi:predicted ATPase